VAVRARDHVSNIDIVVSLSSHVVTGRLVAPSDADDVRVRLVSNGGRTLRTLSYHPEDGIIGPDIVDGGFHGVWASGRRGETELAAWQALDIAGDGPLPEMSLAPTGGVRGRVLSSTGEPVAFDDLAIGSVLWIGGDGFEILGEREDRVSAGGTFELGGILGPRRLYVRGLLPGWEVMDIRVGGTSVLGSGLDVGSAQIVGGVEVVVGPGRSLAIGTRALDLSCYMN
jgi:hypothetical protein